MDEFVVLTTLSDHMLADSICGTLEGADIPVLLEHVEILEGEQSASGVRVLVPNDRAQRAMQLLHGYTAVDSRTMPGASYVH